MDSLIPGYESDIFISYRQKDNKHDCWVTEFVNNLKGELEIKAFVEKASQDQFGLKVKLHNNNVSNRVLPVRIHDLDNNDIKLCESIIRWCLI